MIHVFYCIILFLILILCKVSIDSIYSERDMYRKAWKTSIKGEDQYAKAYFKCLDRLTK